MEYDAYLIFELSGQRYGIVASAVQELFFLPDVTAIAEAPTYIVGVLDLRGEILPVMDLHLRLGRQSPLYQLSDSVIVLQSQTYRIGILVNQVYEVQLVSTNQITVDPLYQPVQSLNRSFSKGVAKVDDKIITLLDPDRLVQHSSQFLAEQNAHTTEENGKNSKLTEIGNQGQTFQDRYAHFPPDARQILQYRTENLRRSLETQDVGELLPLAVIGLADEYFGFGLGAVHEFTDIHRITPVPCCPSHIIGNMNLRGEIITLVDIRGLINLPPTKPMHKAIVVRWQQLVAGVAVDEIFDVVYVHPADIKTAPAAVHSIADEYLQGIASYRGKMMSIINLPKILTSGTLVVNEEV